MATQLFPIATKWSNYNFHNYQWPFTNDITGGYLSYGSGYTYELATSRGGGLTTVTIASVSDITGTGKWSFRRYDGISTSPFCFVTPPLASAVTISGTITFNLWASESNMSCNAGVRAKVYKIDRLGAITLIAESSQGTELGTSQAARNWTVSSYGSVSLAKGDRLMVLFGFGSAGGNMASGYNVLMSFNGGSAGSDGDTYVTFNETLSFMSSPSPSGTEVFLTDSDSDVTGPGVDVLSKEAWTTRGGGVQTALMRNMFSSPDGPDPVYDRVTVSTVSSEGPNYPAVGENIFQSPGSSWSNPGSIGADDGSYASLYVASGGNGYTLRARDFGFADVVGRIMGVKWEIEGHTTTDFPGYPNDQDLMFHNPCQWRYVTFPLTTDAVLAIGETDFFGNYVRSSDDGFDPPTANDVKSSTTWANDCVNDYYFQGQTYYLDYERCTVWYAKWIEWFTPPLAAFTLSDYVQVIVRGAELSGSGSGNLTLGAEVAVVDIDGNEIAVFGRIAGSTHLGTSETAVTIDVAGNDISITDGQRIRIRVGLAPCEAYTANIAYYYDQTFYYAGSSDNGSGDSSVVFSQTLHVALIDIASVYLDLQTSAVEGKEQTDADTVYLDLQPSGTDQHETPQGQYIDYDTISVSLQSSGVEGKEFTDSATNAVDLQADGTDVHLGAGIQYEDSATTPLTFSPSALEGLEFQDLAEASLKLSPSTIDVKIISDSATILLSLYASTALELFAPICPWWEPLPTGENNWFEVEDRNWVTTAFSRFRIAVIEK